MREKWCVVMVGGGVVGILGRSIKTARQTTCTFRKKDRSPLPPFLHPFLLLLLPQLLELIFLRMVKTYF